MLAEIDRSSVISEEVRLPHGGNAFIARPSSDGPHPSIILLHERYGLVQHTKELAIRFATEGHVALAPNLYFREPDQEALIAGTARADVSDEQVTSDVGVAIEHLHGVSGADTARLAVMGVCATGRHPVVVAAERSDISACVVFYGAAYRREWVPKDTLSAFIERSRAPVLGVFGELDNLIAVEDVQRFRNALEASRRSYQIRLFPDAPHGWLNDTMSGRYRRPQAEDAWGVLISFLACVHAGDYPTDRVQWSFEANHSLSYDFSKNVRLE